MGGYYKINFHYTFCIRLYYNLRPKIVINHGMIGYRLHLNAISLQKHVQKKVITVLLKANIVLTPIKFDLKHTLWSYLPSFSVCYFTFRAGFVLIEKAVSTIKRKHHWMDISKELQE